MLALIFAIAFASDADPVEQRATDAANAWAACIIINTRKYEKTTEPASTVVDAAMGSCAQYEGAVQTALMVMHLRKYVGIARSTGEMAMRSQDDAKASLDSMREGYRGKMLAMVMEDRSAPVAPTK
jgi:hypothetical protein